MYARTAWRFSCLLAACATICATRPVLAGDPERATSQYIRDSWSVEQGYPGGMVSSIAQTPDGYLWLGTERGLVQFDGVAFRLRADSKPPASSAVGVVGLAVDTDGALWITRHGPDPQRYAHGRFESALWSLHPREDAITAICRGKRGDVVLAGIVNGVMRFRHDRFETIVGATAVPHWPVSAIAETADGRVWLATKDTGLFSVDNGQVTAVTKGVPGKTVTVLLPIGGASMWIGTDQGAVLWNGTEMTSGGLPPSLSHTRILAMLSDGASNLWIGTDEGLVRVNARGVERLDDRDDRPKAVTALFEDREGNLWVGRAGRLERLREGSFTSYGQTEGMPSDRPGSLHVDAAGRTWFAPVEGGLYWLDNGIIGRVTDAGLGTDVVYSIAGASDEVWVGRKRGGLSRLRPSGGGFETATFTKRDGLADDSVFAVYQTQDGDVWAGTLNAGVSRWSEGALTSYTVADGLASNVIASILQTSDGTMWFATPQGLSARSNGRWHTYRTADGLPSDSVNSLLEDSTGVLWIGTAGGLAAFSSGRMQNVHQTSSALRDQVIGLAEDTAGSLWIATSSAVLQVKADKLRRGAVTESDVRVYDVQDGLRSVEAVRRDQPLARDTKGRIWLSTTRGLSVVDPARLAARSSPTLAHVETMSVDGSRMDLSGAMHLPSGHERITFEFVGLSLSAPQRVRFRYRLDGVDRDWSAPSVAREAIYRDVGPGSYTFRLMAANADGSWIESGAPVAFTVAPAFWQTRWFRLASLLTCVLAAIAAYHIRTRQLTRQLTVRFEERLAERTRIAQELHDTLLQGLLSASMQLHTAVDDLPEESPVKPTFNKVLALVGRVIDEGRHAVGGLRSSGTDDLEQAFVRVQQEFAGRNPADFRVITEGPVRPLQPLIRDEVYRIGREALVNAFRHSGARHIEMELDYGPTDLRILVRDNGSGVDAEILQSGRDGHWGLLGMRERAQRIGGRLTLRSRKTAGTEVELSLPAHVAFEHHKMASRS